MSFTNQTQHYGLPQYIGSDVPAYLTDYNNAMATIDQGMNAAKTQADSAATAAGQAANDIASLNNTVGTQSTQISAAAQAASAAQTTANTADSKADALEQRVTTLENKKIMLITGNLSTLNTSATFSYPVGFNQDNCIIISYQVYEGSGWRVNGLLGLTNTTDVVLGTDSIVAVARAERVENAPIKIAITLV